jgi:hypothetical protein
VKGQDDQQNQSKREFLSEWVRAVNGHGGFGDWAAVVSRHPKDVLDILEGHMGCERTSRPKADRVSDRETHRNGRSARSFYIVPALTSRTRRCRAAPSLPITR